MYICIMKFHRFNADWHSNRGASCMFNPFLNLKT